MARPVKPRRIRHWPLVTEFRPSKRIKKSTLSLGIDEWEAIYLKDIGGLSQAEIAGMMDISRQTVQMILNSAHHKMALALTQGYKLEIRGGEIVLHICRFQCKDCGHIYNLKTIDPETACPKCGSANTLCILNSFCASHCQRKAAL